MFLNLPRDVIRSTARSRPCFHTLRFETATWNQSNFLTCDLCDAQDEQHVIFHCRQSPDDFPLQEICISVSPTEAHNVFTFLSQTNAITSCIFPP